ncbi:MAG: hypothetical protein A3J27_11345 [Candidatus Tectomicrobia bacterium RIFCSPLOWO2_12_FULL_69_37]|nr:MAG: hypothetical protein A3J27_11345 [Candidatus Tectomicrobia bacterium RIFCSPLOWO2_12_FULL_69_37]
MRTWAWEWTLPAPPGRLWPLVSDTDRLNRLAGLPPVKFRFEPLPAGGSRTVAEARLLGGLLRLRYREAPFEWVANRRYAVRRVFGRGPLRWYTATVELHPAGAETRLVQTIVLCLRWKFIRPLIPLAESRMRARFARAYARLAEEAGAGAAPAGAGPRASTAEEKALRLLGRARPPLEGEVRRLLARHIAAAPDHEVRAIRPFALARRFGRPRPEMLEACLAGVEAGALDLTWAVLCPHCRGAQQRAASLAEITSESYCPACNVHFEAQFDLSLEATFSPVPSLRRVEAETYCAGGPQNTPHILHQVVVPAGQSREEEAELPPGAYRVRSPQSPAYVSLRALPPAAPGEQRLEIALGPEGLTPPQSDLPGGRLRLVCRNRTAGEALFLLERTAWADDAATGLDVAFFDRYRRLFGADAFRPGEGLAVQNVVLLFTDLKGSTAMYEAAGDAAAYGRVRDHFGILLAAIRENGGGLVKTIGDAVMASFKAPEEAVRAALAMHAGIARWNAERGREPLVLKMGIHAGHALVVNSNDRLDFFGRMVNISARTQEASQGGDIVLTPPVFEDPGAAALLAGTPHREEPLSLSLRGLEGSFQLRRIWPLAG